MNKAQLKEYLASLPGILKHKEVAEAWINGAEIQFRGPGVIAWTDPWNDDNDTKLAFLESYEYRIKPFVVTGYVCVEAYGDKKMGDISQDRPPPHVRRHWQYFSTEVEVKK